MKVLVLCALVSLSYIGDTESHHYSYIYKYKYKYGYRHGSRHHLGFRPFAWRKHSWYPDRHQNLPRPLETVKRIDIQRYTGRWYQLYTNLKTIERIPSTKDGVCVTADYRVRADGKLDVFNGQRLIFPDGKPSNATGFVFNPDPSEPGKWKVQIQNRQRIGPPGDYWILKLGPKTFGPLGLYEYAIVSGAKRRTLFVLSRQNNIQKFLRRFGREVLTFLKKTGFVGKRERPIPTLQSPKCLYPG